MEVILLENIKNLGKIGDVVSVKRGYGRNFLLKYDKALKATDENKKIVNKKKEELNKKNIEFKKDAIKIFDALKQKKYKFVKKAKENGELYGSVKPREISTAVHEVDKIEIKPSQIDLNKEISKIGSYEATINLHAEVQVKILIEVVKEEDSK
tara:strand:- start:1499 stop:1957 length:459 start_codon:yes stop_codon:yes gene_type:complete